MNVPVDLCHDVAVACLRAVGVRDDVARASADQLIDAERSGYASHGLQRLRLLVTAVERGVANSDPHPVIDRARPAALTIDGDRGLGAFVGSSAVDEARALAQDQGIAVAGVTNVHYSGYLGYLTRPPAEDGLVAIVTSSTPPMVHAFGGRDPVLGTTPLSIAFPASPHPIVLDLATSAGSRGKVVRAARTGAAIPAGWALDAEGQPTTEATAALEGVLSPFGDHKGSGLAVLLTLLSTALLGTEPPSGSSGGVFATGTVDRGDLVIIIDPDALGGRDEAARVASRFAERVRAGAPAAGSTGVRMPGDRAAGLHAADGPDLRLADDVTADLQALLTDHGLDDTAWRTVCAGADRRQES